MKEIVVKGFYAARPSKRKTGAIEFGRISRTFHARDAAVMFCQCANVGVSEELRAIVREDIGVEPLAKGAGR